MKEVTGWAVATTAAAVAPAASRRGRGGTRASAASW